MKCKLGDMAIRIRAPADSGIPNGSIVRCARFVGDGFATGESGYTRMVRNCWEVEFRGSVRRIKGGVWVVPDDELVPLRDPGAGCTDEVEAPDSMPLERVE